jgi:hypothetical protein
MKWFHPGDFNNDGRTDIVSADASGRTWIFQSNGAHFTSILAAMNPTPADPASHLNTGDFNGDGKTDVALLTASGAWFVGLAEANTFCYSRWGTFGAGTWAATFASDVRERDWRTNTHAVLRAASSLYFVSPEEIARLRLNPSYFATIFDTYQYRLRCQLGQAYALANDQVIAFALANIVAYELASYRGIGDPQGYFPAPKSTALRDLLAVPKLVCNEYCCLAVELYRQAFAVADDPDTRIGTVGFSSGPFGNHSQLVFTSGGSTIVADPTLGLFTQTTFANLRSGYKVPSSIIFQIVYRVEPTAYMQNAMASFRTSVYKALVNGLYPKGNLIYYLDYSYLK